MGKKVRNKIQYSKIIINILLFLSVVTILASLYVNLKNGFSLDNVVESTLNSMKYVFIAYFYKSYKETKAQSDDKFRMMVQGLNGNNYGGYQDYGGMNYQQDINGYSQPQDISDLWNVEQNNNMGGGV